MELIAVNENKLKIILSPEDLYEFGIETDDLDYGNPETRLLLKRLLAKAKREAGFDTEGERVLVQLYPSKAGGCEIYITKLGQSNTCDYDRIYEYDTEGDGYDLDDGKYINHITHGSYNNDISTSRGTKKPRILICFEDAEAMTGFCRRLYSMNYSGKSYAYFDSTAADSPFYLFINDFTSESQASRPRLSPLSFAWEYGYIEFSEGKKLSIPERCIPICNSNAVKILSEL